MEDYSGDFYDEQSEPETAKKPLEKLKKPLLDPRKCSLNIVVAGKRNGGKNTLMKNLFGGEIIADKKPSEVHNCYIQSEVKNGVKVNNVYISGSEDVPEKLTLFMQKIQKIDILVYCIVVDESSRFTDENPRIMQCLHKVMGKGIWKKCVVVFTFSNSVWDHIKENGTVSRRDQFKYHLHNYAICFGDELAKLEVEKLIPRSIFHYKAIKVEELIPAIPAGEYPHEQVLPELNCKSWVEEIIHEMHSKCDAESKKAFNAIIANS